MSSPRRLLIYFGQVRSHRVFTESGSPKPWREFFDAVIKRYADPLRLPPIELSQPTHCAVMAAVYPFEPNAPARGVLTVKRSTGAPVNLDVSRRD